MKKYISEMIFTFIFVLVVLGVTDDKKGTPVMCGLAIGLTLVLVHIVCIPITGTSVNPARSIGPALFEGGKVSSNRRKSPGERESDVFPSFTMLSGFMLSE